MLLVKSDTQGSSIIKFIDVCDITKSIIVHIVRHVCFPCMFATPG